MELTLLDLSHTRTGGESVARLAAVDRIGTLDLSDTDVTDRGVAGLTAVRGLSLVDLSGTRVTAAGVAALQRALPAVRIVTARRVR